MDSFKVYGEVFYYISFNNIHNLGKYQDFYNIGDNTLSRGF